MPPIDLAAPQRTLAPTVAAGTPPAPHGPVRRRRRDDPWPRILRWALAASVALHVFVLIVSPSFLRVGLPPGETDTPHTPARADGLQMVEVRPGPIAAAPPRVVEAPAATTPTVTAPAPVQTPASQPVPRTYAPVEATTPPTQPQPGAARTPAAEPGSGGAADALRPGYRDPRLYVPPRETPAAPEPTEHERYMERLQARIDAYNDSIGAAADRARRATDWTVKDKSGKRWGISPEGVHLGGVTVPVPIGQSKLGEKSRESAEEARQRDEIGRHEQTREQRDVMRERARATRERKDAERAEKKAQEPPPPGS
jgi:hypothetical protein